MASKAVLRGRGFLLRRGVDATNRETKGTSGRKDWIKVKMLIFAAQAATSVLPPSSAVSTQKAAMKRSTRSTKQTISWRSRNPFQMKVKHLSTSFFPACGDSYPFSKYRMFSFQRVYTKMFKNVKLRKAEHYSDKHFS